MEVVGLVSLAIQLIDKLQALANNQPVDQTQQFTNDIASSIALLGNVQDLANRARALRLSSQSQILIHLLTVQPEDYMDKLKEWHTMGQRLLNGSTAERHQLFKRFMGYKFQAQKTIGERIAS
jgi:hypothetical protein